MDKPGNKKKVEFEEEPQSESEADEADDLGRQLNKFQFLEIQEAEESSDEAEQNGSDQSNVDSGMIKTSTSSTKSKSKNRRRNKNKRKAKSNRSDIDIDNLLSSSSENQNAEKTTDTGEMACWSSNCHLRLIKIDVRHLTPENELVRMFGKSVIKEERARESKSRHQLLAGSGHIRSRFVSTGYHDSKAILLSPGPKMELDNEFNCPTSKGKEPVGKNKSEKKEGSVSDKKPIYFKIVHEKSYQTAHNMFLDAAQRGDSDRIIEIINLYPTHVESLIQLSDMLRVSEDYRAASQLIERTLLIFEAGFHQLFNFASGNDLRLSYLRSENRSLFVTIFKHIYYLSRRGLRRTPLEYTKLLLALEPDNDPLFATLLIDFYAIRSEEYDFLIEFITKWQHLAKLPNMNFSLALAHYMKSKSLKRGKAVSDSNLKLADEYLQQALMRYPNFIITLLDACSAEPDPELLQTDYFNYSIYSKKYKLVPESISLLMSIYVERNLILWNKKDVLAWLERNTALLVKQFASKQLMDNGQNLEYWSSFRGVLPRNLLRHIVLSELKVKVPPSASSSTNLDIDPFPPTNSITSYLRDNTSSSSTNISNHPLTVGGLSSLFIRTILPSYGLGGGEESVNGEGNSNNTNS